MEELRQQLGDRLPGSFQTAAKSMGLTERELTKLVESGQLASDEFIRNFIPALNKSAMDSGALAASLETSRVAMQRFNTAVQLNILEAFDAGAEGGLADFFNNLSATLNQLAPTFKAIGKVAGATLTFISTSVRALIQTIRPLFSVFETLFGSTIKDGNGELQRTAGILTGLISLAKRFAGIFLLPFGALERFNNKYSENTGGGTGAGSFFKVPAALPGSTVLNSAYALANARNPSSTGGASRTEVNINITANDEGTMVNRINDAIQETLTTSLSPGL